MRYLMIVVLALLTANAPAAGQSLAISAGAGVLIPQEAAGENFDMGAGGALAVDLPLGRRIALRGALGIGQLSYDPGAIASELPDLMINGGGATILSLLGGGVFMLPLGERFVPYAVLGAGAYLADRDDIRITWRGAILEEWDGATGLFPAVFGTLGFRAYPGSGVAFFAESGYMVGLTEGGGEHFVPIRIGLSFEPANFED